MNHAHDLLGRKAVLRCDGQCHMSHCATQVDLHAGVQKKSLPVVACNNHHVDAKRSDIVPAQMGGEIVFHALPDVVQQFAPDIFLKNFRLFVLGGDEVSRVGTVLCREQ